MDDVPATRRPLVLVHGWGESSRVFDRLVPLLPPAVIPHAVDLPGHGTARESENGYGLPELADWLAGRLTALSPSGAVVLGTSSGGYLAQQLAVDHQELVAGLVLVGAPADLRGRPPFTDEVEGLTDPVDAAWVRDSLSWFPFHQPVPASYIEDRVRDGAAIPARVWQETFEALRTAVPPTAVGAIRAPTLVLAGANDDLLGTQPQALVAAIPAARLVVFEDTGHLVLWERPDEVAAEVAAFVGSLPSVST